MQTKNYTHEERTFKRCTFVPKATDYLVKKKKEASMTPIEKFLYAKKNYLLNKLMLGPKFRS